MVQIVSDYTLSHIDKFVVLPMEFGNENDIKLAVGLLSITSNIISIMSREILPILKYTHCFHLKKKSVETS